MGIQRRWPNLHDDRGTHDRHEDKQLAMVDLHHVLPCRSSAFVNADAPFSRRIAQTPCREEKRKKPLESKTQARRVQLAMDRVPHRDSLRETSITKEVLHEHEHRIGTQ
jgi:hypothetical protein